MKTLLEAEAAANNAAVQLVSFKDTMDDEFEACFLFVFLLLQTNPKIYIPYVEPSIC
jgi:hypothetical protein